MKASEVKVGQTLWRHGYAWRVTAVHYDPRGNNGTPRMVFDAVQVDGPKLPAFYAEGMELGYNLDADVTI
jgi:hypothetical protein